MSKYRWVKSAVLDNLEVKQVYGVAFFDDGKVLLRVEDGTYKLTGGKPEIYDTCFEDTLIREYLEEINVKICDIYYLGYQLVDEENGLKPYAQVRMIARIEKIGDPILDVDSGKTYKRFLANFNTVQKYLNYTDSAGKQLIDDAILLAKEKYHFNFSDKEYFA